MAPTRLTITPRGGQRQRRPREAAGQDIMDSVGASSENGGVPGLRSEERWAAACVEAALTNAEARQHDDGSAAGMYDLSLWRSGQQFAAVEVTAAADPESIVLWHLMNGGAGRWQESALAGGWMVTLLPTARAKVLRQDLPDLLRALERVGQTELFGEWRAIDPLAHQAARLGIARARQGETAFAGSIYVTIELPADRVGGVVASTGDAVAGWLDHWLQEPQQQDNVGKLERAQVEERHLFVLVPGFTTAPFSVADLLMRDEAPLPTIPLALPPPISHLWIMSTWRSGAVFRWSNATGWRCSRKVFDVAL